MRGGHGLAALGEKGIGQRYVSRSVARGWRGCVCRYRPVMAAAVLEIYMLR